MRACCLALMTLLSACEFMRDPVAIEGSETQFGVFGILTAGTDTASVMILRFTPEPTRSDPGWEGVGGATVRLIAGSDTIPLVEQPSGSRACARGVAGDRPPGASGCYRAAVPGGINSDAIFRLVADVPGFGRVTGSATIPRAPVILAPAEGAALPVDIVGNQWPVVRLRIDVPPGTQRLEATLTSRDPARTCEVHFLTGIGSVYGLLLLQPREADSVVAPFRARCYTSSGPEHLGELPAAIRVTAFDSTYARFARDVFDDASQTLLSPHTRAGIDRGVGYFAGAAASERRVVLTGGGS